MMIQNTKPRPERRGGKRENSGRRAKDGAKEVKPYKVLLDQDAMLALLQLGDGNLSAGVRKAGRMIGSQ